MIQKHRGQRQTHPGRKSLWLIERKGVLQHNVGESQRWTYKAKMQQSPHDGQHRKPWRKPQPNGTTSLSRPFPQLGLRGLLLSGKLDIARVHITKDRQQQLVCHILQSHGDLATRKEKCMGGTTPSVDQMTEIEQVPIIRQATGWNDGL